MNRTLLLLVLLLPAVAAQAVGLTYPIYKAPSAPLMTGDIQADPAWQAIPASTGFSVLGNGYTYVKQTTARMLWDDQALYIGVVCEEPDAAQLKPQVHDFGDTWTEDSLELFIMPALQAYQIAVTAGGAKGGFEGGPDVSKVTAAAKIGKDFYSIEVRIPFTVVKGNPKAGDQWRGEVCRNIFTGAGDKFTSWSPLKSRFLEPDNFAILSFKDEVLSPAQAAQITEQLNAPYRGTLTAQIKAAAGEGAQYQDALKQAQNDPKFGEQAGQLLEQWQNIAHLNEQASRAGILDLRQALMKLQMLNDQSYQVKYKFLIEKLLTEN